uniref:Uncharacterized protein n=1 Tax=Oryza brachyantha TaxID=4533 RepID=J3LXS2_ORYBR
MGPEDAAACRRCKEASVVGARDGNGDPRSEIRWVFTLLVYGYELNILHVGILMFLACVLGSSRAIKSIIVPDKAKDGWARG